MKYIKYDEEPWYSEKELIAFFKVFGELFEPELLNGRKQESVILGSAVKTLNGEITNRMAKIPHKHLGLNRCVFCNCDLPGPNGEWE